MKPLSRSLKLAFKVLVSVLILGVLAWNLRADSFQKALSSVSPWEILALVVLYLGVQLICAYKWLFLARSMGLQGTWGQFCRYYLLGMFFGLFLPTGIGGDVGRATLLAREQDSRWLQAFLSTVAERACGLTALMTFVALGVSILRPEAGSLWLLGSVLASLGVFYTGTLFFRGIAHHPLGEKLIRRFVLKERTVVEDPGNVWPRPLIALGGIGLSALTHALLIGMQWFILRQLGAEVPLLLVGTVSGLAAVATMVPVSFSGIGLREGSAVLLLIHWGHVNPQVATLYSLIWLAMMVVAASLGGVLLLREQLLTGAPKKI